MDSDTTSYSEAAAPSLHNSEPDTPSAQTSEASFAENNSAPYPADNSDLAFFAHAAAVGFRQEAGLLATTHSEVPDSDLDDSDVFAGPEHTQFAHNSSAHHRNFAINLHSPTDDIDMDFAWSRPHNHSEDLDHHATDTDAFSPEQVYTSELINEDSVEPTDDDRAETIDDDSVDPTDDEESDPDPETAGFSQGPTVSLPTRYRPDFESSIAELDANFGYDSEEDDNSLAGEGYLPPAHQLHIPTLQSHSLVFDGYHYPAYVPVDDFDEAFADYEDVFDDHLDYFDDLEDELDGPQDQGDFDDLEDELDGLQDELDDLEDQDDLDDLEDQDDLDDLEDQDDLDGLQDQDDFDGSEDDFGESGYENIIHLLNVRGAFRPPRNATARAQISALISSVSSGEFGRQHQRELFRYCAHHTPPSHWNYRPTSRRARPRNRRATNMPDASGNYNDYWDAEGNFHWETREFMRNQQITISSSSSSVVMQESDGERSVIDLTEEGNVPQRLPPLNQAIGIGNDNDNGNNMVIDLTRSSSPDIEMRPRGPQRNRDPAQNAASHDVIHIGENMALSRMHRESAMSLLNTVFSFPGNLLSQMSRGVRHTTVFQPAPRPHMEMPLFVTQPSAAPPDGFGGLRYDAVPVPARSEASVLHTREGFTRNTAEDMEMVCPGCDAVLEFDPAESVAGDASSSARRKTKAPAKHHLWALKACGHVYCNNCFKNRNIASKRKAQNPPAFRLSGAAGGSSSSNKVLCAVEECPSEVNQKMGWVGIFM